MTQLTRDPTPDWNPRWSPDGREMLFYALRSGNRDIWVMPSSGGPARQLTSRPEVDWYATWSPDGHEIAYATSPDGEVWIMDATGGQRRLVTKGTEPAWSPDGEWLVVRREERLLRVAKNGGEPQPFAIPRTHLPNTPRFSRDGQSLYYAVARGPRENYGIWRLSLRDSTISRLTKLDGTLGTLGYYFSADARYLYFLWREPEGDIWVMDVVAGKAR